MLELDSPDFDSKTGVTRFVVTTVELTPTGDDRLLRSAWELAVFELINVIALH